MRHVRIFDDVVLEIIDSVQDDQGVEVPIEARFHPDVIAQIQPDPNVDAIVGGSFDGVAFGPVPTRPLADIRTDALVQVDTLAETARLAFITPGAGQALVYEAKRSEAVAWQAVVDGGGSPVANDYPLINARANRLSVAPQAVADEWNIRSATWLAIAAQIEGVREAAKEAVALAADDAAIKAIILALLWPQPK